LARAKIEALRGQRGLAEGAAELVALAAPVGLTWQTMHLYPVRTARYGSASDAAGASSDAASSDRDERSGFHCGAPSRIHWRITLTVAVVR